MKPDGRAAFPRHHPCSHFGMSLRDYFAAKAMQFAYYEWMKDGRPKGYIAKDAYEMADVMLAERAK